MFNQNIISNKFNLNWSTMFSYIILNKMTVDKMTADKMIVDKMTCCQLKNFPIDKSN